MIPKKIHYTWFGHGEKPKLAKKCIASWKKYCPDYEIVEWNEDNFNVNMNSYTKMCYKQKKYAFLSDYVRLLVIYEHGGLYFDTDVELIRNPDFLLNQEAFLGFEIDSTELQEGVVNTGEGFGAVPNSIAVKRMIEEYDILLDGNSGVLGCPGLNTKAVLSLGLKKQKGIQYLESVTVYPSEYFNPYQSTTGALNITENTVSIHWYNGSWLNPIQQLRSKISKPLHRVFGVAIFNKK